MSSNEYRRPWERAAEALRNIVNNMIGRGARHVKLEVVRCRGCHHVINAREAWVRFDLVGSDGADLWHFECLDRARGGTLQRPDPLADLPTAPTGARLN